MPNSPLEERLDTEASLIRSHVPSEDSAHRVVAGIAHADLLEAAAAEIRSLRDERDRLREALDGLFTVAAFCKFERGDEKPPLPDFAYDRAMSKARSTLSSLGEGDA